MLPYRTLEPEKSPDHATLRLACTHTIHLPDGIILEVTLSRS
jgi:hypothetical protein